jgi:hypothetical protein
VGCTVYTPPLGLSYHSTHLAKLSFLMLRPIGTITTSKATVQLFQNSGFKYQHNNYVTELVELLLTCKPT